MEDACNGVFSQTSPPDVFNYSIIQKVFCMCCICKENFIILYYNLYFPYFSVGIK